MSLKAVDYWRLADALSVVDAAILVTGNDPSKKLQQGGFDEPIEWVQVTDYDGYEATFKALKEAILSNRISASIAFPLIDAGRSAGMTLLDGKYRRKLTAILKESSKIFKLRNLNFYDHDSLVFLQDEPDWNRTMIDVEILKNWFKSKGFFPDFFFPQGDPNSFMNKEHPRYSPKLACAVSAWRAVTAPARNKTPKQTVEAWVTANGVNYGLANEEGVVPGAAIEEVSKVVNWQTKGGAARTGGGEDQVAAEDKKRAPDQYEPIKVLKEGYEVTLDSVPF